MHTTFQDLRYAFRMLRKAPGFAAVAVLTLAIGVGANTAIFTVVNTLLLSPLPYGEPERLVMVWQDFRARGGPADEWATPGNVADWRSARDIFEDVAAIGGWRPTYTGGTEAEPITGEQVSHEYFRVLGISPALGRSFGPADDVPNAARVVMISDALWKRRFGADRQVVGRIVTLSGEPHEIIGVVPSRFRPVVSGTAEIWRPLRLNTTTPSRGSITLRVVGKLAAGVPVARAQDAAAALARRLETEHPQFNEKVGFNLQPLHDRVVGDIRPGLLALLVAVAFVLLIACVNIANLLLARASSRGRELAVRLALGAGRGRVVRQILTESLLLAALGGIAGVILGIWAVDALISIAPASAPRVSEIRLDVRVLGFAAVLTIVTGILFGLGPALHASRGGETGSLKDGARGAAAGSGASTRRVLIAAEVALALMLLTGGGLLLQTFMRLQAADLGFDPQNVLVGSVNPPRTSYDSAEKHRAFYDQVLQKASALPGVRKAALASVLPLSGDSDTGFAIEGRPAATSAGERPITWYRLVSAGYFETMGIQLRRGRGLTDRESAPSVVVNETFVRRYFPGEEAIGRRIQLSDDAPWFTIIGVAADARVRGARGETQVETFVPYWQLTEPGMNIILKADSNPGQLTAPLKQAVASLDPNVPVSGVEQLSNLVAESIDQPRFFAVLSVAFALLALGLAAIGIYGVMAYAVAQRTTEIGVRMALGATPKEVFRLVIGDGLRITAIGIAIGIAGSLLMARWLTALLFGVTPGDPVTLAFTATLLLLVATAACYLPARRATRVDPMVALRAE